MKRSEQIMNYFKDGLSVDETKVSVLMFAFLVTLGFALWQFATIGLINAGMLQLLGMLIGAITGINIVDKISNRNNHSSTDEYDNIGG
jgi:hypothetical protein